MTIKFPARVLVIERTVALKILADEFVYLNKQQIPNRYKERQTMSNKYVNLTVDSIIQAIIFILLGIAVLGIYVLESGNTLFTYTLFGIAAILFEIIFKLRNLRDFIFICAFIAIFIIVVFLPSNDFQIVLRNFLWFLLIGVFVYANNKFRLRVKWGRTKSGIVAFYLLGILAVYIIGTLINVFVFGSFALISVSNLWYYLSNAIKTGGVLGFGLGLGKIITIKPTAKNKKGIRR
jgi:hypothetical protein